MRVIINQPELVIFNAETSAEGDMVSANYFMLPSFHVQRGGNSDKVFMFIKLQDWKISAKKEMKLLILSLKQQHTPDFTRIIINISKHILISAQQTQWITIG